MSTAPETIRTETVGRVGVIHLSRARKLNAINGQMMQEATEALRAYSIDPAIGAIVLAAEGRAFSAGFDLKELAEQHLTTAEPALKARPSAARTMAPMAGSIE